MRPSVTHMQHCPHLWLCFIVLFSEAIVILSMYKHGFINQSLNVSSSAGYLWAELIMNPINSELKNPPQNPHLE